MKNETQIMVRMSDELKEKLHKLAEKNEMTVSAYIRMIIKKNV